MSYTKTADTLDVYIQAPGLKPESIEVQVDGNSINVKALTRPIPGLNRESGEMYKRFSTRHIFTLNPDTTKVEYQDGILHIYVERLESEKPKSFRLSNLNKVEVKSDEMLPSGTSE
jgi:HSP20 family protein